MFALEYHETTKHHFNRFARSAGRLDWATQPDPFRHFLPAPRVPLSRDAVRPEEPYASLYTAARASEPVSASSIADFLRCAMGLSAWKQYRSSRWALRVNPSSGNLHPTEAYLIRDGQVSHYLPREHALETRGVLPDDSWPRDSHAFLVGLSSIFWREAWKYGERAFRYCQHDVGHAIAALRLSASRLGWRLRLLPWPDPAIAAVLGLDRDDDFAEAEREAPECIALVSRDDRSPSSAWDPEDAVRAAHAAAWVGRANRLSSGHVDWSIIERIAAATEFEGPAAPKTGGAVLARSHQGRSSDVSRHLPADVAARAVLLHRRSAVAFDARSALSVGAFMGMLERLHPAAPPWDALDWEPEVDLAVFVHRVEGLVPGLYAFVRTAHEKSLRAAFRSECLWEPVARQDGGESRLFLLLPLDVQWPAIRLSCDQDIAGDGYFSLGMLARFESSLREHGEWFYRRLFWECGLIGQVLYLEAETVGGRGTGIGCFYDDAVHEVLGLGDRQWQSLYHFSMGVPVHDPRMTMAKGYDWESGVQGDLPLRLR